MELPDDYFTEEDAIRQMQAEEAAVNYRRQWEEQFQYWENLTIHRDDDDGAERILEAEYISDAAHAVVITADKALLDINQVRQLRDWLNEVLDEYADEWNERLAAGFGGT